MRYYTIYQLEFDEYEIKIVLDDITITDIISYETLSYVEILLTNLGFEEKTPDYMS